MHAATDTRTRTRSISTHTTSQSIVPQYMLHLHLHLSEPLRSRSSEIRDTSHPPSAVCALPLGATMHFDPNLHLHLHLCDLSSIDASKESVAHVYRIPCKAILHAHRHLELRLARISSVSGLTCPVCRLVIAPGPSWCMLRLYSVL